MTSNLFWLPWIDISLPGFLCFDFNESLILGKAVGSGGGGDLYAAELINQSLIDKFKEKHVVVKYVRGTFLKKQENPFFWWLK